MWEWFQEIYNKSWFEAVFYFAPMILCAVAYPFEIIQRIAKDKETVAVYLKQVEAGNKPSYYGYDFITIGDLFKYLFLTITPIINVFALMFDAIWVVWAIVSDKRAWLFNIKLVEPPAGMKK